MSSISAGTSGGTALVQSGDTTGALVIKTGGSAATAATFNADQSVTLAQPLPVASGGTGATSLSGITVGTATSATTATNLSGGSGGTIPYQTSSGTTAMLAAGTSGYLLQSNGTSAPSWTPAPTPAGSVTATASGSLSDGSMVILNSDGTVSVVAGTVGSTITTVGSATSSQGQTTLAGGAYDTAANAVFIAWRGTSSYLYGIAGSISGNTITFGSPVTLDSTVIMSSISIGVNVVYCSVQNCHVVLYSVSNTAKIVTATVSGNTVTQRQTNYGFASAAEQSYAMAYDSVQGRLFITWFDAANGYKYAGVGAINNTSKNVSVGGVTVFDYSTAAGYVSACYEPVTAQIVVVFRADSNYYWAKTVQITSNTSYTMGTAVQVSNWVFTDVVGVGAYYTGGKVIFGLPFTDYNVRVFVGTISGTSISVGSYVSSGLTTSDGNGRSSVYSISNTATFIACGKYSQQVTVSGSTPTLGSTLTLGYTYFPNYAVNGSLQIINTSVSNGFVTASIGEIISTNLTSTNFLGISNGAYTNGQTATIQTVGSTDDAQSGLTPGLQYYVTSVGSLNSGATTQPYAGLALSATKLVIKG